MAARIPAAALYQIQEEDLRNAIVEFREGALPPTFEDSTRFDLLVDGQRRLPPKAIAALAARRPLGRVLSSDEFVGGESSTLFRLLLARGFEFATKSITIAGLNATVSVGRNRPRLRSFHPRGRRPHLLQGLLRRQGLRQYLHLAR